VSTKELARVLGKKTLQPCTPDMANKHTGYLVGGTSPFGTRRHLTVCVEATILDLPRIYLNGGKRGYLVSMASQELVRLLSPILVRVAIEKG
jgi:Cys-tRNA(Pro) deacylase